MPNIYGAQAFRFDPITEAVIMALIGADGLNPTSSTNGMPTETLAHIAIGNGKCFVHNNVHTGIAAGASYYHVLTTGASSVKLTYYNVTANTAPIWLALSEAPTFSGGTTGGSVNKNRTSATTASSVVKEGVTVTYAGAHLEGDYVTGSKQDGGRVAGIEDEWILQANTSYLFTARNDAVGAAIISFHLEWIEQ